ncbi:unnamed protein product, partial [Musa textilis]
MAGSFNVRSCLCFVLMLSLLSSCNCRALDRDRAPPPTPSLGSLNARRWAGGETPERLNREVLPLRGLDPRLSTDLPPDLQKLRCKVAFHALRFSVPVQELGNKLATRMRSKVGANWLPSWSQPRARGDLSSGEEAQAGAPHRRSNMACHDRKLAGLCPLNAAEVTRYAHNLCPSSLLAAIDDSVCEKSDVFMTSHGRNMGHLVRGQRAY